VACNLIVPANFSCGLGLTQGYQCGTFIMSGGLTPGETTQGNDMLNEYTLCADCQGTAHDDEGYTNEQGQTVCLGCYHEDLFYRQYDEANELTDMSGGAK